MTAAQSANGRARLSRDVVVQAAIAFVDEFGLAQLTMRRLGKQLGVEAMSLYRYVNSREDLLDAMVEELINTLRAGEGVELPSDTWQAYLQWLAHSTRVVATEHPHLFPLIATRNPAAPWLRPPLRSLAVVEEFLHVHLNKGFSDVQAVTSYQMFCSFLLGHSLVEATERSVAPTLPEQQMSEDSDESLAEFPTLVRLRPLLARDTVGDEFEDALEVVIGRIERMCAEQASGAQ